MFNLLTALRGYPWSIYVVREPRELVAVAHTDRPIAALGFLGMRLSRDGDPKPPYALGMNYNYKHTFIPITRDDFGPDGMPSTELLARIEAADRNALTRRKITSSIFQPEFFEAASKRPMKASTVLRLIYGEVEG